MTGSVARAPGPGQYGTTQVTTQAGTRVAADGSVANKVGTYGLAVLARHHGGPFVVAAPVSSIDMAAADGSAIVVEHRDAAEVTSYAGRAVAPAGSAAYNPAFDVTPAGLVTALVTERGIAQPVNEGTLHRLDIFQPARAAAPADVSVER